MLYQQQLPQPVQPQLGMMNHLKEQLEERTRILQADIKTQQQELHDIKEKLQLANFQVTCYARMLTYRMLQHAHFQLTQLKHVNLQLTQLQLDNFQVTQLELANLQVGQNNVRHHSETISDSCSSPLKPLGFGGDVMVCVLSILFSGADYYPLTALPSHAASVHGTFSAAGAPLC